MSTYEGNADSADREIRLSAAPPLFAAYSCAVLVLALLGSGAAYVEQPGGLRHWGEAGLVLLLALGFDETSRRAARLRIRLSEQLRTDMTSVWAVAASASLPRATAVTLLAAILAYDWFRHHRPAGESLYRKLFVTATILLGCLASSLISHVVLEHAWPDVFGAGSPLPKSVSVLAVIVVYTLVQRVLVTTALVVLGARGRALIGSRDDNLIELATLCLGGLVGLALDYEPLLAVLALAPMITLHRGALVRELETAATTDAKTGLLNAIAWEHLAQREVARAKREGGMLAVLIIDIDHFKRVNDEFGHLVGDMVLRGLGRELVSVMREYDSAGRFGGEEFVVVLPDAAPSVAMAIAERIRTQVNNVTIADLAEGVDQERGSVRVAVSVGVAVLGEHGTELIELLQSADTAMYRAKSAGRNRVVLAERGVGGPALEAIP